ncbi:MAG TPA: DUF4157 domain-containing protein [Terriglobales bacterium]|nr:DUF4157 domain-containing protein [Terriglobales bacterium]
MSSVAFAEKKSSGLVPGASARSTSSGLRIGPSHDSFEQEADRVADEVMGGGKRDWSLSRVSIDRPLQRKCSCGGSGGASGQCEECKEKDKEQKTVQRKAAGPVESDIAPPIVHSVLNSPGRPLDKATRDFFEPRFGYDFSNVRVHTGTEAAQTARSINALAYTAGSDVVFGAGQYAPETSPGRKLLAHELVHVFQQRHVAAPAAEPTRVDHSDSQAEREAQAMGRAVISDTVPGSAAARALAVPSAPVISRAEPQVVSIGMNVGTAPRSGLQFSPTNIVDTQVGPSNTQGGLSGLGLDQLHVIIAENETLRRLARQLLPFFLTATPFTPPGAVAPLPLTVITEDELARALLVYNQYFLAVPAMTNWRAGLNFPLPIEINTATRMATLNPSLIRNLAGTFSAAWVPLLDSHANATAARPAATLQNDVAVFLAQTTTALGRGMHLAALSLTNAVAELAFVREAFRQLGPGAFDVALVFMETVLRQGVDMLAAQRDGADILAEVRNALGAAPANLTAAQQASLASANAALARVAGTVALPPPGAARARPDRFVTIDTVKLDGSNHTPSVDVAVANDMFTQCNIKLVHGVDSTATPLQTTTWLGGDTDLRTAASCGSSSHEERAMFNGASAQFGMTGRIRAFFVATFSNQPGADAYSNPPFCASAGAGLRGMAVVENVAGKGVLGHECVHIIQNSGTHLPDPNLMGSDPLSTRLNDKQCDEMYGNSR